MATLSGSAVDVQETGPLSEKLFLWMYEIGVKYGFVERSRYDPEVLAERRAAAEEARSPGAGDEEEREPR